MEYIKSYIPAVEIAGGTVIALGCYNVLIDLGVAYNINLKNIRETKSICPAQEIQNSFKKTVMLILKSNLKNSIQYLVPLGIIIAASAQLGSGPKINIEQLIKPAAYTASFINLCASSIGIMGYYGMINQDFAHSSGFALDLFKATAKIAQVATLGIPLYCVTKRYLQS